MADSATVVGCCGWTEAQSRYVQDFEAVEVQSTFYQPPSTAVARRWKELAPRDFRFCMKAWQLITHTPSSPTYRRLQYKLSPQENDLYGSFRPTEQVDLAWERTREIAQVLNARVVLFQCPPSFLPTPENLRNLSAFFSRIDRDSRLLAWEPRGGSWKPELVREICQEHGLVHCVDPLEADSVHRDFLYWRLHGRGGKYRYTYTLEDLHCLRRKLHSQRDRVGPNYILFNNFTSLKDALRFLQIERGEP